MRVGGESPETGNYSNEKSERSKLVGEKSRESGKCSNGKSERSKQVG